MASDVVLNNESSLVEQLGYWLKKLNFTVATAESCTGGRMAAKIASIPGCSDYFYGSIVAYQNSVKTALLGVNQSTLDRHGAVSQETALQMVEGVCKALKTTCGIATTGIAGPSGAVPNKPVGTVWIAVRCGSTSRSVMLTGDQGREMNIEKACNRGMFMLLELLQECK